MEKFKTIKSIPAYLPIVNVDTDIVIVFITMLAQLQSIKEQVALTQHCRPLVI